MKVLCNETTKIPIKMWLDDIDDNALEQAKNLSNLPFAFKHIAIMPDSHFGYGMPIGGVMATKGVIIPNAVGVDIGCGMCAVKTSLTTDEMTSDTLKKIMGEIRKRVPVGFNKHEVAQDESLMPHIYLAHDPMAFSYGEHYDNALKQLGTLGGGNHFIEIQKDNKNCIWIMIHSGSRKLGYEVAKYYNDVAISINKQWYASVPASHELAYLPLETIEGSDYMKEMQYCVCYAVSNRLLIMKRIKDAFNEVIGQEAFDSDHVLNIAHNYARIENHFGQNVVVHRKGATSAQKDQLGIIPGSQGTKSYIVKGLGNPESFNSCSHGAGRKMGRKQAIRELNLKDEVEKMNDLNITHSIRNKNDLDEAPGAYKNIKTVMENQKDLVEIVEELTPIGVIKG